MNLNLRSAEECRYDAVSLGEIMLRLDPGEGRIRTAREFKAWEGGGEYNVVRGLLEAQGVYDVTDVNFTPFDYRFADECAGVYATVRIEVGATDGICEADYDYEQEIKII